MLLCETNRLLIRTMEKDDLVDFHEYRSNPEVVKYQGFDIKDLNQCKDFIMINENKTFPIPGERVQYSIVLQGNDKVIGDCALHILEEDRTCVEVGITISHRYQQQGFAKEAMLGLMKLLFLEKDYRRIVETADLENIACIKLLEALKFRKEGEFKDNIFFKGAWGSEVQYAMLALEYKNIYLS